MKQHINIVVIILIGVLIAPCYACSRGGSIVDQGKWTKISSFEDSVVKDTYTLINGKIYYGGFDRAFYDSVLCSRSVSGLPYLKEADIETFEVCENSCYARDAHHVYAPLQIMLSVVITCIMKAKRFHGETMFLIPQYQSTMISFS